MCSVCSALLWCSSVEVIGQVTAVCVIAARLGLHACWPDALQRAVTAAGRDWVMRHYLLTHQRLGTRKQAETVWIPSTVLHL